MRFLRIFSGLSGLLLVAVFCGCRSMKVSEPARTSLEQLLLSTAADRAIETVDISWIKGKKVFVEEEYFESYDKGYAMGNIRQLLSDNGALLMRNDTNADIIVEPRSGALGMQSEDALIGIPALGVPVPLAGPLTTPELSIYKSSKSDSVAKFALFAYERETGQPLRSAGPMVGKAKYHYYKLLGISWIRTDIPELKKKKKSEEEKK